MDTMRKLLMALMLVLMPAVVAAADAPAADPAAQTVQGFYDALLDTMKHGKELGLMGRYNKLKPAIEQAYNLPLMTSLAVGPSWPSLAPADQQALIAAFERMTIANYAKNFDGYGGESFVVDPNVQNSGGDKRVLSKLVTSGQTIAFNYRLRQTNGTWKIIDVYLQGFVSELATRRSDFGATLSAGGAAALIKKIDELSDRVMKG
jgi:phospholipid transport system substrate-binding protein